MHEEFLASGRWLFRRRAIIPVALFGLVLWQTWTTAAGGDRAPLAWSLACFLVSLLGLALRIYTVGHAAPKSSGRDRAAFLAEELNTTGAYSVTRHPIYLANGLIWLGPVLVPRSGWLVALIAMACWLCYERIMMAEEEFLRCEFGERYLEWARRTPTFLPAFRAWRPSVRAFNLRGVLRREYSGLFQLVLAFAALDAVGARAEAGRWTLGPVWLGILAGGVALAGVLRLLWKRTALLDDAPVTASPGTPQTQGPARQSRTGPSAVAGDAGVPSRLT